MLKKILAAIALGILPPVVAFASPYFRSPLWAAADGVGPSVHYTGAFIDPKNPGKSTVGTEVALVTHDPKDGCLFPSIVCEQWSPLATGLSATGGKIYWDVGPTVNVFPWMTAGLAKLGLPTWFKAAGVNGAFAFGPKLNLNPIADGKFQPASKWDAKLVFMTAFEVRWN